MSMGGTALVHDVNMLQYSSSKYCFFIDINECNVENAGCEQICTNQEPFFSCSCHTGYSLYNEKFCSGTSVVHES